MPKVSEQFGPIYQTVTLDGSGNGTVSFQAVGSAIRITNIFFRVATSVSQAVCTIYKGQVADGNIVFNSNSGSTGGNAKGNVDLFDGETCFVRWTGGDASAVATATFTGQRVNFSEIQASELTFDDPIAAGDGSLIFPAIKSPNYVAGVSGWRISRDGDAEFNDLTARGDLLVTGNNNSYIRIYTAALGGGVNASVYEYDAGKYSDNAFPDPGIGQILATTNILPDHYGQLSITSPLSGTTAAQILMHGATEEGGTDDTLITIIAAETQTSGILTVGTHVFNSIYGWVGDGVVDMQGSVNPSAAISITETVVLTSDNVTFKAGRAYEVSMSCPLTFSAVPNRAVSRLRKTNPAGLQLGLMGHPGSNTGTGAASAVWSTAFYVSGSDVTTTLVWTGIVNAGAVTVTYNGATDAPRTMKITDIGEAAKVSSWGGPQLT